MRYTTHEDERGIFLRVTAGDWFVFQIDVDDLPLLGERDWRTAELGSKHCRYVTRSFHGKQQLLHRVVTGAPKGMTVDHRDGSGLNNRRYNLRIATVQQNRSNNVFRSRGISASGKRGVYPTDSGRWQALISIGGKLRSLGTHDTLDEAARIWDAAAIAARGEFTQLNFAHIVD